MTSLHRSVCLASAISIALLAPAFAAPIPVLSEGVGSLASSRSADTLIQRQLIAEMSDVRVTSIRTPSLSPERLGATARGAGLGAFDASNPFHSFRPDFHDHWSAERGGLLRQRFGRTVYPNMLGGFGVFGDAIYAAHGRFRPVYESTYGTNQLGGWFVGEFDELAELFDLIIGSHLADPIADRFPGTPKDSIVAIPLPGSAAMAFAGLLIIASRRRR
ncbi:MAG: hypothetical protein EA423_04965 [Phycisphaerales bacterium]|nr:MAG: hypothetical protein EA423_04965 [Phycisphaerales bacterium]